MPSNRRSNAQARGKQQGRANGRNASPANAVVDPTANDIVGVALVALAAAMTVALLVGTPAQVTQMVGEWLRLAFGQGAILLPLAILMFAITFFMDNYGPISGRIAVGLMLVVLSILSLMSLTYPGAEAEPGLVLEHDVLLQRGGYTGGGVAWALLRTVGFGVGVVVLVFVLVVGAIVCGFSVSRFVAKLRHQAAATAAEVRASQTRRAAEREAKRAERRAERERRLAERGAYDEYAGYADAYDDYAAAPVAAESEVVGGVMPPVPATSYIGDRKTTVLRRGGASGGPNTARIPAAYEPQEGEGGGFAEAVGETLSALPTKLLRRKDKPADTRPDPYVPGDAAEVADAGAELPWDAPADEELAENAAPAQVTIPDFLRAQAEAANDGAYDVDFGEDDGADEAGAAEDVSQGVAARATAQRAKRRKRKASTSAVPALAKEPAAQEGAAGEFALPPFELLTNNPNSAKSAAGEAELTSTMRRLQATLNEFGLKSRVVEYVAGPLVTTFHIEMGEGERVSRITNLEDDIALSLAAESVRIFAPIPGTSRVGIEIPNKKRENVYLGDVLPYAKGGALEFAIGRDAAGRAVIADLAKMPHLLVAGATGSGKSVMVNTLIMSILMRNTPKDVRLILVDPKRVEFSGYNGLPHLYVPVVTEPRQAASALQWAVSEMERRLKVFEKAGARNIGVYNEMCVSGKLAEMDNPPEPMPFLVIIIDELSDLMMVAGKDVEASIVRIAQLARAAGIHLVLATQRPSADVVTGLIKSNIETRIALSVASSMDSRVILDQNGADRLLGNGDMLFKYKGHRTTRVLGCYVADEEINAVVDHWRGQGEPDYHEEILSQVALSASGGGGGGAADDDADDPLVWEAAQIVVESRLGSTSGLQRRLKVGYARAGRIMDMLEQKGVVGPPDGSKPREVLLDEEGLEDLRTAEAKFREV